MSGYRRPGQYVAELDGLRGIGALAIVTAHANIRWVPGAAIALEMFFVLSAFLITGILIREYDSIGRIQLGRFYMRRALRIFPALLGVVLTIGVASALFHSAGDFRETIGDCLLALLYVYNWASALDLHDGGRHMAHAWSLAVEGQFYLLWPVCLIIGLRLFRSRVWLAAALIVAAAAACAWRIELMLSGASFERVYSGTDGHADAFLLGSALGVLSASGLTLRVPHRLDDLLRLLAPAAAVLLVAALFATSMTVLYQTPTALLFGIHLSIAILILGVIRHPNVLVARLLRARWLVWLGTISYSLYLWHVPIGVTLDVLGRSSLFVLTVGSALSLLAGAASYYYIERPFLRRKRLGWGGVAPAAMPVPSSSAIAGGRAAEHTAQQRAHQERDAKEAGREERARANGAVQQDNVRPEHGDGAEHDGRDHQPVRETIIR